MDKQIAKARIVVGLLVLALVIVAWKTVADIAEWAEFIRGSGQ